MRAQKPQLMRKYVRQGWGAGLSSLTMIEKRKLEKALGMESGYFLQFSNRTFAEYFLEVAGIDIYDDRYDYRGGSKANHMRAFWEKEDDRAVARVLAPLFDNWGDFETYGFDPPSEDCRRILERLQGSPVMMDAGALTAPPDADESFDVVARHVRDAIDRNEPEAALDRLHTYLVKYLRTVCQRHGIEASRDKPLHSLMGEYLKALRADGVVESEITERILKTAISVCEAFNHVRNEMSLAHDNELLNHDESVLVFAYVAALVRFVDSVEGRTAVSADSVEWDDEIPF